MSEPQDKPYSIPKRLVWEAYERVKANKGAGVDRQSVEDFEKDLRNNVFKIWNRMASGTYRHRACHPAHPHPGRHGAPHRRVGQPGGATG